MSPRLPSDETLTRSDALALCAQRADALADTFGSIDAAVALFRRHEPDVLALCATYPAAVAMVAYGADDDLAFTPRYDPRDAEQVAVADAWRERRSKWIADNAPHLLAQPRKRNLT